MTQRYMELSPAALDRRDWAAGSVVDGTEFWRRGGSPKERSMARTTKLAVRQGFEPWIEV
jgi:hypothetical protein